MDESTVTVKYDKGLFKNYVTARGERGSQKVLRSVMQGRGVFRHALRNRADFSGNNYFVKNG